MTLNSTKSSSSIFKDGKLKPGIYKIQNIYTDTYLDIEVYTREVCCRPAKDLGEQRGIWEIKGLGAGYTVQAVEPGKPEQFCTSMEKLGDSPLGVSPYPVAWNIEAVDDEIHRGFEYVRFRWRNANWVWDLAHGYKDNGTKVWAWSDDGRLPQRIWRLIPVKIESMSTSSEHLGSDSLPSYDGDVSERSRPTSTHAQHIESEHGEFGTIVNEVTVVTTTTRKRYRVEDA